MANSILATRGNLPHLHMGTQMQFATFRLADSLPQSALNEIRTLKQVWDDSHPQPWSEEDIAEYHKQFDEHLEKYLDAGYGSCCLRNPEIRKILETAIFHFNNERYIVHAFVIMPNHVHVLFEPLGTHATREILHSWKSYSANKINRVLGQKGPLWMPESFDRFIRSDIHLKKILGYISSNPKNLPESDYTLFSRDASWETRLPASCSKSFPAKTSSPDVSESSERRRDASFPMATY